MTRRIASLKQPCLNSSASKKFKKAALSLQTFTKETNFSAKFKIQYVYDFIDCLKKIIEWSVNILTIIFIHSDALIVAL